MTTNDELTLDMVIQTMKELRTEEQEEAQKVEILEKESENIQEYVLSIVSLNEEMKNEYSELKKLVATFEREITLQQDQNIMKESAGNIESTLEIERLLSDLLKRR